MTMATPGYSVFTMNTRVYRI